MLGGAKKNRGGVMLGGVMLGGANKWIEFLQEVKGQKFESKEDKKKAYDAWLQKEVKPKKVKKVKKVKEVKPKVTRKSQRVFLDDVEEPKVPVVEDLIDLNYDYPEYKGIYPDVEYDIESKMPNLRNIEEYKRRLFDRNARKPLELYDDEDLVEFDNTITRLGSGNKWIEFLKEVKGQKFASKEEKKTAYEKWMKKGMKPKRKVPESLVKKAQNPRAYDTYDVRKRLFNKSSAKPLSQYTKKEQKALHKLLKSLGSGMKKRGGEWYNDLFDVVKTVAPVVLPLLI